MQFVNSTDESEVAQTTRKSVKWENGMSLALGYTQYIKHGLSLNNK